MRTSVQWEMSPVFVTASMLAALLGCGGAPGSATTGSSGSTASSATSVSSADLGSARGRIAHRVQMTAEGVVDFRFVIPAPDAPPINAPPPPPGLEYRARYTFPSGGDDVMDVMIFAAPQGAPNGGPPVFVISEFLIRTDRFETSHHPSNNLMFSGRVIATPVPSPFGEIIGRLASITGGYTAGPNASFTLLGGPVSGSHTTELPTATGSLVIRAEDREDD